MIPGLRIFHKHAVVLIQAPLFGYSARRGEHIHLFAPGEGQIMDLAVLRQPDPREFRAVPESVFADLFAGITDPDDGQLLIALEGAFLNSGQFYSSTSWML